MPILMRRGYIRLAAAGQPENEQRAAMDRAGVCLDNVYADEPPKRRAEGAPALPQREKLIRSLRLGAGDEVVVAEEGTIGLSQDDTLRVLAIIAEKGARLYVAGSGKTYQFEPSAAGVMDLLREGEHQRATRRAANARRVATKMGKGGVKALKGAARERAKQMWHDPKVSWSDIHKEFEVSRTTFHKEFGGRGTPDVTRRGRRT